jgi:hypothetical protein
MIPGTRDFENRYPKLYPILAPMLPYIEEVMVASRSPSVFVMFVVLPSKEMAEAFVTEYPDELKMVSFGQANGSGFPCVALKLREEMDEGRVVSTKWPRITSSSSRRDIPVFGRA